ncbi:MAG: response regulator, partial [Fimbriimonas ginsengisoli]|nr:response regulator [Fimbriimonas ginsengisoli]
ANLASNAVKFTESGEVTLAAELVENGDEQARIRLLVRDTGIGIPEDRHLAVFQSFTQADGSTTRRYGGTGLGLTICSQLVHLMGGEITLQSAPGEGSTFSVELDLPLSTRQVDRPAVDRLKHLRALCVDDNATNLLILERQLATWGCEVVTLNAGEHAAQLLREALQTHPFDFVILDMQMPGLDGEQTAATIRALPELGHVPLILLSSMGSRIDQKRGRGFAAVLTKPVRQANLRRSIMEVLGQQAKKRAPGVPAADAEVLATLRGARVLLAEDNAINTKVALQILSRLGCSAVAVENGLLALEALERESFDLVLMDVQMPHMDGLEASRKIRKSDKPYRDIPIVALTANAMAGDRDQCLAAGMNDYLPKPVKPAELSTVLVRWIKTGNDTPEAVAKENPNRRSVDGPLDASRLRDELGFDEDTAIAILREFRTSAIDLLDRMAESIKAQDVAGVKLHAHTLKGSAKTIGAPKLAEACRELERAAEDSFNGSLTPRLRRIERELRVVLDLLAPRLAA